MKIVVGLGNPGEEYRRSRHNLGFLAVEDFCRRRHLRWSGRQCRSRIARVRAAGDEVLIAKPETYMNRSGEAVACLLREQEATPSDLLVVCDDVALELGQIRVRASGRDGGHRGLGSIIGSLSTERFARLRIGICTPEVRAGDLKEEVLSPFTPPEWEVAAEQVSRAAECIELILEQGVAVAMNRFNRRQPRDSQIPPGRSPSGSL